MINIVGKTGCWLELGCGNNPHPAADIHVDVRYIEGVTDFVCDLNEPLPIKDVDFDGVLSIFSFEHVSWRKQRQLLAEVFRILRPSGRLVLILPNTEAQIRWVLARGWDKRPKREGMGDFEEASCVLFGDQTYKENSHSSYFSPTLITELLTEAGFRDVLVRPFGEISTDMIIEAMKSLVVNNPSEMSAAALEAGAVEEEISIPKPPIDTIVFPVSPDVSKVNMLGTNITAQVANGPTPAQTDTPMKEAPIIAATFQRDQVHSYDPSVVFDMTYFDKGKMGGGFAGGGYRDFSCHELTAQHILARKPKSVLEVGCSRGYVLKRIQDAGIRGFGIDVSKHCWMTRVCNDVYQWDITKIEWPMPANAKIDLCFSIAVLEHIPENKLPAVVKEMARVSQRGLHGIFFCPKGIDSDKTKSTLKSREWWVNLFHDNAPNYPVELLDKDELEKGQYPDKYFEGDGSKKLNIGCAQTCYHRGWENLDCLDMSQFCAANGFKFKRLDVRDGLPHATSEVSLIYSSHMLEHLNAKEGISFLRECRRVLKLDGFIRVLVPDAELLMNCYQYSKGERMGNAHDFHDLSSFDCINYGCAESKTAAGKIWSLLHEGHASCYDAETLLGVMDEAGFVASVKGFRESDCSQMLRDTVDMLPGLSLVVEGKPRNET